MSDYIPTTAEVRDAYSSESSDSKFANRAFDLWLARYKAKIIAQTEERIIKLLEERFDETLKEAKTSDSVEIGRTEIYMAGGIAQAIALIKGEEND